LQNPVLIRTPTQKNRGGGQKKWKRIAPGGKNPTPAGNRAADFLKSRAYARIWGIVVVRIVL